MMTIINSFFVSLGSGRDLTNMTIFKKMEQQRNRNPVITQWKVNRVKAQKWLITVIHMSLSLQMI